MQSARKRLIFCVQCGDRIPPGRIDKQYCKEACSKRAYWTRYDERYPNRRQKPVPRPRRVVEVAEASAPRLAELAISPLACTDLHIPINAGHLKPPHAISMQASQQVPSSSSMVAAIPCPATKRASFSAARSLTT